MSETQKVKIRFLGSHEIKLMTKGFHGLVKPGDTILVEKNLFEKEFHKSVWELVKKETKKTEKK